jgi:fibro-slime domain-containing protein
MCGTGNQVCEDGFWQNCVVPTTARPCSNTCGEGEEKCADDAWLPCSVPVTHRPCSNVCGAGTETCVDDVWQACDGPPILPPTLTAEIRNFMRSQPDFAPCNGICGTGGVDPSIVEPELGADGTPVYAGDPTTPSTHGQASFDQWYHGVPGVNEPIPPYPYSLPFTTGPAGSGTFVYDNEAFFPVDTLFFRDQGLDHNYWFTAEVHAQILYLGGETYAFASDDDLWVFINRRLAVDLGGVHAALSGSVSLDDVADILGIVKGQTFPLDLFYADRQPINAVLTISIPTTDIWSCHPRQ